MILLIAVALERLAIPIYRHESKHIWTFDII